MDAARLFKDDILTSNSLKKVVVRDSTFKPFSAQVQVMDPANPDFLQRAVQFNMENCRRINQESHNDDDSFGQLLSSSTPPNHHKDDSQDNLLKLPDNNHPCDDSQDSLLKLLDNPCDVSQDSFSNLFK